ncbi:hypothetical protein B0H10DRAFT_1049848 [Mycena sp. CBHHK59/15]|nr:hypothetical protein B0H10DRAFT_1049848 [Mycena sp. CBHHK59/15]
MPVVWRSRLFILLVSACLLGLWYSFSYSQGAHSVMGVSLEDIAPPFTHEHPPSILLVSAFFPLSKSKHTMREYEWWLCQFLRPITADIYFYTPVEIEPLIRKCRGRLPITINTTFSTPFDIPPLVNSKEQYGKMHAQDRERKIHSAELYAVWNGKPYFLDEAVKALSSQGKDYEYAFWNDAGSFRSNHNYTDWPALARVHEIWEEGSVLTGEKKEDLLFFPVCRVPHPSEKHWQEHMGPVDNEFSEGSFFGGSPQTIAWWRDTYYAYHDYYLGLGIFVGKDQTLINALFLLFPSRVITVWLDDPDAPAHKEILPLTNEGALGNCHEEWFYYQFWLATSSARESMQKIWESSAWWKWGGWRQRHECRLTRVLSVQDLLRRQLGNDWQAPKSTIRVVRS